MIVANIDYVPGAIQSIFDPIILSHLILIRTFPKKYYYYFHFIDEEMMAKWSQLPCPKTHS